MPMIHYKPGDVLVTNFPFADKEFTKKRPVLCLSVLKPKRGLNLYWVLMITSTKLEDWTGDIEIKEYAKVGLPIPSMIRTAKIACVDTTLIDKKVGKLDSETFTKVSDIVSGHLK